MRICHVTPHLPPDQSANALLPVHLGRGSRAGGDDATFVSHPPRSSGARDLPGPVTWIPWRDRSPASWPARKLGGVRQAARIARRAAPAVGGADIVHLHSNGLLIEVGAWLARRYRKPTVLTIYGTEIWHYRRRRTIDLFTRAYDEAGQVTFYSERLRERAGELGLRQDHAQVIYPPVAAAFSWRTPEARRQARAALGLDAGPVLLNVKRLHPLAGQRYAIDAMADIARAHPGARLIVCGAGPLRSDLETQARRRGVTGHVRFAGLVDNRSLATYYAAADLFLLPSLLEAAPTVALEALACGTPVLSADNPGGLELNGLFNHDVMIVPREDAGAMARAANAFLGNTRRTSAATQERIERDLRPERVYQRFREVYERLLRDRAVKPQAVGESSGR